MNRPPVRPPAPPAPSTQPPQSSNPPPNVLFESMGAYAPGKADPTKSAMLHPPPAPSQSVPPPVAFPGHPEPGQFPELYGGRGGPLSMPPMPGPASLHAQHQFMKALSGVDEKPSQMEKIFELSKGAGKDERASPKQDRPEKTEKVDQLPEKVAHPEPGDEKKAADEADDSRRTRS